MPSFRRPEGALDELDTDIASLHRLAADLERIRDGLAPTDDELAGAPLLDGWRAGIREVLCLRGRPFGHPILVGSRDAVTSPVWVLDTVRGYALTESRFYRLGRPAGVKADG